MALGLALEALSFGSVLGLFLICKFLEHSSYISRVYIHTDMFVGLVGAGTLTGVLVHVTVT
jgi:hypothetical protein